MQGRIQSNAHGTAARVINRLFHGESVVYRGAMTENCPLGHSGGTGCVDNIGRIIWMYAMGWICCRTILIPDIQTKAKFILEASSQ